MQRFCSSFYRGDTLCRHGDMLLVVLQRKKRLLYIVMLRKMSLRARRSHVSAQMFSHFDTFPKIPNSSQIDDVAAQPKHCYRYLHRDS